MSISQTAESSIMSSKSPKNNIIKLNNQVKTESTKKLKTIINRWGHTSIYYNNKMYKYGGLGKENNS